MKTTTRISTLALLLALATPAAARADEALDAALAKMATATGDDYAAARKAITDREGVAAELDKVLEGTRWTDDSFRKLAMATIARAYLARPDLVEKANHLQGLDATQYLQRRRPDPEATRELRAMGKDGAGVMLERYLKTFDSYPFTKATGTDDAARAAELAAKERIALRVGIVIGLSQSGHPSAFFVCREVARSASEDEGVRSQAIEGLGDVGTREAFAELGQIYGDREQFNDTLRLAAIRGVGAVPSASAVEFLAARLGSESATERKTAVVSLGALGSAWGWDARGDEAARTTGDRVRREAAAALVGAIDKLGLECGDEIVDALATVAHESSIDALTGKAAESSVAKKALERVQIAVERNKK